MRLVAFVGVVILIASGFGCSERADPVPAERMRITPLPGFVESDDAQVLLKHLNWDTGRMQLECDFMERDNEGSAILLSYQLEFWKDGELATVRDGGGHGVTFPFRAELSVSLQKLGPSRDSMAYRFVCHQRIDPTPHEVFDGMWSWTSDVTSEWLLQPGELSRPEDSSGPTGVRQPKGVLETGAREKTAVWAMVFNERSGKLALAHKTNDPRQVEDSARASAAAMVFRIYFTGLHES